MVKTHDSGGRWQRPHDTSPAAASEQAAALGRLGPEGRVRAAVGLSEAVRSIHVAGLLARQPGWSEADAVRQIILEHHGLDIPGPP